jgi:hypothetical protein
MQPFLLRVAGTCGQPSGEQAMRPAAKPDCKVSSSSPDIHIIHEIQALTLDVAAWRRALKPFH